MLIKTMKDASGLVNAVGEELEAMTKTALSMELSTILHALDAFQSAQSRMKTMNKRTEMEMTFIRLCTPEMDTSPAALLRRIEALERGGCAVPSPRHRVYPRLKHRQHRYNSPRHHRTTHLCSPR